MQTYPPSQLPNANVYASTFPRQINAVQAASRIVATPIRNNANFIEEYQQKENQYIQIIKELYEENKRLKQKQNPLKSPIKVVYSEKGDIPFKNISAFHHQSKHPVHPYKKDQHSPPKKENIVIIDKNNSFYLALDPEYKEELRKVTEGDQADTPLSVNEEPIFREDDEIDQPPLRYPMNEVKESQSLYSMEEAGPIQPNKHSPSISQKLRNNMKKCNSKSQSQESEQEIEACSIGFHEQKAPIIINNIHYIAVGPERDSLASQNSSSAEIVDIKRKVYSRESHLLGNNYNLLCQQKGDENNLGNINKFGRKLKRFGHSIYM